MRLKSAVRGAALRKQKCPLGGGQRRHGGVRTDIILFRVHTRTFPAVHTGLVCLSAHPPHPATGASRHVVCSNVDPCICGPMMCQHGHAQQHVHVHVTCNMYMSMLYMCALKCRPIHMRTHDVAMAVGAMAMAAMAASAMAAVVCDCARARRARTHTRTSLPTSGHAGSAERSRPVRSDQIRWSGRAHPPHPATGASRPVRTAVPPAPAAQLGHVLGGQPLQK